MKLGYKKLSFKKLGLSLTVGRVCTPPEPSLRLGAAPPRAPAGLFKGSMKKQFKKWACLLVFKPVLYPILVDDILYDSYDAIIAESAS